MWTIDKPNRNKEMKIVYSILLSRFMSDNEKCNISHVPSSGLSGIQFSSNTKCICFIVPVGPEKKYVYQHWDEVEWLFTVATQHLTPSGNVKISTEQKQIEKLKLKGLRNKLEMHCLWVYLVKQTSCVAKHLTFVAIVLSSQSKAQGVIPSKLNCSYLFSASTKYSFFPVALYNMAAA